MHREPAPAGADLEHVVGGPEVELVAHHLELRDGGLLQRHIGRRSKTAQEYMSVWIEHAGEQLVPQVVMRRDVLAAARRRVAQKGGTQPLVGARTNVSRRRIRSILSMLRAATRITAVRSGVSHSPAM